HRFDGIYYQVHDDLLQLHSIGRNPWKLLAKLASYRDLLTADFFLQQREDLANEPIDVQWSFRLPVFLEHRPDPADHLARMVTAVDYALYGGTRFIEVRRRIRQPTHGGIAACDDCYQRLVDFMRN